MRDYAEKEIKILSKINKLITKLDNTLDKMDNTESRIMHFIEQEKAIHELKALIRNERKLDKAEADARRQLDKEARKWAETQLSLLEGIDSEIGKLEKTLKALDETESKVKSYFEQKKAIHEIKKIMQSAELLEI